MVGAKELETIRGDESSRWIGVCVPVASRARQLLSRSLIQVRCASNLNPSNFSSTSAFGKTAHLKRVRECKRNFCVRRAIYTLARCYLIFLLHRRGNRDLHYVFARRLSCCSSLKVKNAAHIYTPRPDSVNKNSCRLSRVPYVYIYKYFSLYIPSTRIRRDAFVKRPNSAKINYIYLIILKYIEELYLIIYRSFQAWVQNKKKKKQECSPEEEISC